MTFVTAASRSSLAILAIAATTGGCRSGAAASARDAEGPPAVRWLGRVDASNPARARFAWSGSGFAAIVHGARIAVRLRTEGDTATAFFQPVIDGTAWPRFQVKAGPTQTVLLADGLPPVDHVVEVIRETEGAFGDSVFEGFAEGNLVGSPPPPSRLIEVVGDSITAGYGTLGVEVHPPWDNSCSFSLETESAYKSYAAVLGRALHADVSVIARSGWGVVRDGNGNAANVLPSLYGRTLGDPSSPDWDFRRPADVVVVNLGTNDVRGSDPGRPFEQAYGAFLATLRAKNPRAWIFLTMGTMTAEPELTKMRTHIANVAAASHDLKVLPVDLATQDATHTGCDYHPDANEQQRIANVLGAAIKSKLGW